MPHIDEATRIQAMRLNASKGGRAASGAKKRRPQEHYEKLAAAARARKIEREKNRASLGL